MTDDTNLERLCAGRLMAIDRTRFGALAERARIHGAGRPPIGAARSGSAAQPRGQNGAVSVIPMAGPISGHEDFFTWLFGGCTVDGLMAQFRAAIADASIVGIVLAVDSPGGGVDLVPEASDEIRRARGIKPIVSVATTCMCSAAYWIASSADEIVASPSADVGSIGVIACHYDESGLNAKLGISPTYLISSSAPFKAEFNSDAPLTDAARRFLQQRLDETEQDFVTAIAANRRTSASAVRATYGGGRAFSAAEAKQRGMVDSIGTLESTIGRVARMAKSGRQALSASQYEDEALRDEVSMALAIRARK